MKQNDAQEVIAAIAAAKNEEHASAEAFLASIFGKLGDIAERLGITTSRQVELLQNSQVHRLHNKGRNQQEIMAATGLSLKTVRKVLKSELLERVGNTDYIGQFIGDWASDREFPLALPIKGTDYPGFKDLCDRYGREFTAPALLKILQDKGLVAIEGNQVMLLQRSLTPTTPANMLELGSASVCALLGTLEHNFALGPIPFVERRVRSERIPKELLVTIRQQISELIHQFRQQVINYLAAAEARDGSTTLELVTAGIGVFWYEDCE